MEDECPVKVKEEEEEEDECGNQITDQDEGSKAEFLKKQMLVEQQQKDILVIWSTNVLHLRVFSLNEIR